MSARVSTSYEVWLWHAFWPLLIYYSSKPHRVWLFLMLSVVSSTPVVQSCLWSSYWWGAPHCVLIMLRAKLKEALLRAFNQKRFHFGGFRRTMPKGQRSCMLVIPWILWKRIFGLSSLDRRGFKALTPFAARNPASPTTSRVFWIPFTRCPIPSFHCLPSGSL